MLRLSFALVLLVAPLQAAQFSGSWSGTLTVRGHDQPVVFQFLQAGSEVTGAFGTRPDFLWPLRDVRLSGSSLTFTMSPPMGGPPTNFAGALEGGTISGQVTSEAFAQTGKLELRLSGPLPRLSASFARPASEGDLAGLSDEFDGPDSLRNWKNLSETEGLPGRIERIDIGATNSGQLTIVPQSGAWWAGYHGVYLYKEVKGDFVVTTRLKVTGKTGGEPAAIWTISGLLLRAPVDLKIPPAERRENWMYVMTGRGPAAGRVVDAKSTIASNNVWDITPAQSGWYELRLARLGPLFVAMCRPDGGEWVVRKRIFRTDLPETLQAGINVTSDFKLSASMPAGKYNAGVFPGQSAADSLTAFDYVRFRRIPAAPALRTKLAGADVPAIADSDIMALLQ